MSSEQNKNPFINVFFHDEETINKFRNLDKKGEKISKIWETPFFQVKKSLAWAIKSETILIKILIKSLDILLEFPGPLVGTELQEERGG